MEKQLRQLQESHKFEILGLADDSSVMEYFLEECNNGLDLNEMGEIIGLFNWEEAGRRERERVLKRAERTTSKPS